MDYRCKECKFCFFRHNEVSICPECGGEIETLDAYRERTRKKTTIDLTATIKLDGYDEVMKQLNDIEQRIDRIIEKQKQITGVPVDLLGGKDHTVCHRSKNREAEG